MTTIAVWDGIFHDVPRTMTTNPPHLHRHRILQWENVIQDSNPCNSEFAAFTRELLEPYRSEELLAIDNNRLPSLSSYYKVLVDQNEDGEYFGIDGVYTESVMGISNQIENFWITQDPSLLVGPVNLLGAHGNDIASLDNKVALCERLAQVENGGIILTETYTCIDWANDIDALVQGTVRDGYNNSLLTLIVAVFFPEITGTANDGSETSLENQPVSIVVGDGMFHFFESSSIDSIWGIDFVLAHEWCHVLQVRTKLIDAELLLNGPVQDKERIELMCDAFSSYFMAHPSGANLPMTDIEEVSKHAMTLGDAQSDDAFGLAFHGTPGQRECAAIWGAMLAHSAAAANAATISVLELAEKFNAVYSDIYGGSETVCPGITGIVDCTPQEFTSGANDVPSTLWLTITVLPMILTSLRVLCRTA